MRLLDLAADMERELGKTVVGGDISLYRGILRALGVNTAVAGHGRLLASL